VTAIFISHRSSDSVEAQAIKDWLSQQGHERLFLNFDPADGIPAGVDWEQRLYQELPGDATLRLPAEDRVRGQLGAVVADDHQR
jgi:hypothetical protein